MVSEKIQITNAAGLHLRPASNFCQKAIEYPCSVRFRFRENEYNAKSVISVLSACVKSMDEIELICDGEREEEALQELSSLVRDGMGERFL